MRQATGWDCGNCRECGGVRIFATALKKKSSRINRKRSYSNISKDFTPVQDSSIFKRAKYSAEDYSVKATTE